MGRILFLVLNIFLSLSVCGAAEKPQTEDAKFGETYSLGYEFGSSIKRQEMDVDIDVLLSAARDALEGRGPVLSPEEIRSALKDLRRKLTVAQGLRQKERLARNLEEGKAFLEANRTKEGVKTLPSGLQYMVLRDGSGPVPKATDMVKVNYRGTLINGTEFDSSYDREPIIIHVDGMMRGWTEALKLMKMGAKWKIFVPTELAYAEKPFGRIPPNSALIFEIELLDAGENLIPVPPEPAPAIVTPGMIRPPTDEDSNQSPADSEE